MNFRQYLSVIFFALFSLSAFALDTDKNEPLYVNADTVSIDNKTGLSTYEGNVVVNNGSTHLTAQRATVQVDKNNQIEEANVYGNDTAQAHYWTLTDLKKPEMHAYADHITLFPKKHLIYLIGHAKVNQGADSYAAPRIEYNTETQHVFSAKSNQGQTVIVIHPNNFEKK